MLISVIVPSWALSNVLSLLNMSLSGINSVYIKIPLSSQAT